MSAIAIGAIAFACCFGASLAGLVLHLKLPGHHLDGDSKDVVKLVMGLIATMAALVLGLLIASAQSSYNTQAGSLQKLAADIVQLDHMLALYGAEARDARNLLRQDVAMAHDSIWSPDGAQAVNLNPQIMRLQGDRFFDTLQTLAPRTEAQRFIQGQVLQLAISTSQTRALMFQQAGSSVPWPFLVILITWLSVLFLGFGLFARMHATVAAALLTGALSVAAAMFLILELGSPYSGLIRLSDEPLRGALAQLGQTAP